MAADTDRAANDWVKEDISCLTILREHDCLVNALQFLSPEELNTFALTSKGCHHERCHNSLDQTRSGTIVLGQGASDTIEFIEKVNENKWADKFQGNLTHLRLKHLPHLSAKIEPINEVFIQNMSPMKQVQSLDCSIMESSRMLEYAENLEKGLAQGLILSLLFPNLQQITLNSLPLTVLGISLIAEGNKSLRVIRWEKSIIWPISDQATSYMRAFQNITELYLDGSRMIFCWDLDVDRLWRFLAESNNSLKKVSLKGTQVFREDGQFSLLTQESMMMFVRATPTLRWFRSHLTQKNITTLKKVRPDIEFVH
ncbi:unnamed protein product [Cylindrotheca closterium]|uniref:Uncharacterized protein n=1 Tax=Cylindrotheca closterium TaxID=2856 RepID=A0AAD2JJ01_9STRA|nr:unnamed protein product [Cylindrotheca closterium]